MIRRILTLLLPLVALAGCTSGQARLEPAAPVETTSTTAASTAPAGMELWYGYEAGMSLAYDVTVHQEIRFTADGNAAGFGGTVVPIAADLTTESIGRALHSFQPGPRADTVDLTIAASFEETAVTGSVNGSNVDSLEGGGIERELALIDPIDTTLTLNPRGEILGTEGLPAAVTGADLAALAGVTSRLLSMPLGPVFPDDRTPTVGDVWESVTERNGQDDLVRLKSRSEVISIVDGVYLIHTTTVTDAYEVDFSGEFRRLFMGFAGLEEGQEIPPEVQEQMDRIEFSIFVSESTVEADVEFDPATGTVTRRQQTAGMEVSMRFRSPDQATGEITGFDLRLEIVQSAVFTLAG